MSVLLPQKDNFSSKFVKFYRKVFPSVDEKYWRIYKSNIYETIKFLSVSELRWEIFKSRAELESKFTFIWSSVIVGVISAGIFSHGLNLATQVIALGEAAKNCMITTVYEEFFLMENPRRKCLLVLWNIFCNECTFRRYSIFEAHNNY